MRQGRFGRAVATLGVAAAASLAPWPAAAPAGELAAGITTPAPAAEILVRRGQKVVARVEMTGITVTLSATALEDGVLGRAVLVKNERSGKRLRGTVVAVGAVRIDPEDIRVGG